MEGKEIREVKEAKEKKPRAFGRVWEGWSREFTTDGSANLVNCQVIYEYWYLAMRYRVRTGFV